MPAFNGEKFVTALCCNLILFLFIHVHQQGVELESYTDHETLSSDLGDHTFSESSSESEDESGLSLQEECSGMKGLKGYSRPFPHEGVLLSYQSGLDLSDWGDLLDARHYMSCSLMTT